MTKSYSDTLTGIADFFAMQLDKHFDEVPVPGEWPWENIKWTGNGIRWAHLEKYYHPKASILHLVIMPEINNSADIFGFDLIELNGQLTGLFLDFTPTVNPPQRAVFKDFENPRAVPDWADFFSPYFVCCRPQEHELPLAANSLTDYLDLLESWELSSDRSSDIKQAQLRYLHGQRKNPQTRRMLTAHIGQQPADEFIDTVLFPIHDIQ